MYLLLLMLFSFNDVSHHICCESSLVIHNSSNPFSQNQQAYANIIQVNIKIFLQKIVFIRLPDEYRNTEFRRLLLFWYRDLLAAGFMVLALFGLLEEEKSVFMSVLGTALVWGAEALPHGETSALSHIFIPALPLTWGVCVLITRAALILTALVFQVLGLLTATVVSNAEESEHHICT